jgi:hypothetical protein
MTTFEQFLIDRCQVYTNNSPEGFENWLERQDTGDIMDYAEMYGMICRIEGKEDLLKELKEAKLL